MLPRLRLSRFLGVVAALATATSAWAAAPAAAQVQQLPDHGAFHDDDGAYYEAPLNALAERGILAGTECAEGRICPDKPIKRSTMAVWLGRSLTGSEPTNTGASRFADVDAGDWTAPHIERFAELGVTLGCAAEPLRYCPDDAVTRAQMAAFLVRAFELDEAPSAGFADTTGHYFETEIDQLAKARITLGCAADPPQYCPNQDVTRGQMATFLARALGLLDEPSLEAAISDAEAYMIELVNELRNNVGVAPITLHDGVAAVARRWSNTMLETGEFKHNPTYVAEFPPGSVLRGENIARVPFSGRVGNLRTVTRWAFEGLSDSPGHYGNMVHPGFGQIGVGIAVGDGHIWVTQNFACYPPDPGTRTCDRTSVSETAVPPPDAVSQPPLAGPCMDDTGPGTYVAVETNAYNIGVTYAVRTDGRVVCLIDGLSAYGWHSVPGGNFIDISSGQGHRCAIRTDRTLACWSDPWRAHILGAAPAGNFAAVAAGEHHTCALRAAGSIVCWGYDVAGETSAPDGGFRSVTAGGRFSCGLRIDSTVACWGYMAFSPSGMFTTIEAGPSNVCGLRTDGRGECWDRSGQQDVPEGSFTSIYAGTHNYSNCGIRPNGAIECWTGRSGHSYKWARSVPHGNFAQLSLGIDLLQDCGLRTDQTIVCWGEPNAALANRNGSDYGLVSSLGLIELSRGSGLRSGCGLRADKSAVCWGRAIYVPPDEDPLFPEWRLPLVRFYRSTSVHVIPGEHTEIATTGFQDTALCLLHTNGRISCSGDDLLERLVDEGSRTTTFVALAAGPSLSPPAVCGIASDETLVCWGDEGFVAAVPSGTFSAVDVSGFAQPYACAIRTSGSLACWGNVMDDDVGTPGDDTIEVPPPPTGTYSEVSVGNNSACALRTRDQHAVCWSWRTTADDRGYYLHTTYRGLMVREPYSYNGVANYRFDVDATPDGAFASISNAIGGYACGLRINGSIECWGSESNLQPFALNGSYDLIEGQCGLQADSSFACRTTLLPEGVTWNRPPVRCHIVGQEFQTCESEILDGHDSAATGKWRREDTQIPAVIGYDSAYSLNFLQRFRSAPERC